MPSRLRKGLGLLAHPYFVRAAITHRVAAASEHLAAIRICAANTLIDAGANKGQFSLAFRALRSQASIIAFEPLPEAADKFNRVFGEDSLILLHRVALTISEGTAEFHVTNRTDSSSLLRPGEGEARAFGVHSATTIEVPTKRLDQCIEIGMQAHPILLKVDVQGGEIGVFEGCQALEEIDFIYVELSFVELYAGQPLFQDVSEYLAGRGFIIAGIFNQVFTAEYGPTQVDALFKRVRLVR